MFQGLLKLQPHFTPCYLLAPLWFSPAETGVEGGGRWEDHFQLLPWRGCCGCPDLRAGQIHEPCLNAMTKWVLQAPLGPWVWNQEPHRMRNDFRILCGDGLKPFFIARKTALPEGDWRPSLLLNPLLFLPFLSGWKFHSTDLRWVRKGAVPSDLGLP